MARSVVRNLPAGAISQLQLESLITLHGEKLKVTIIAIEEGYSIRATFGYISREAFYLAAEHARRVRVFKTSDAALNTCRRIGLKEVTIEL